MYDIFSLNDIKFPEGFLWGTSTAGHQIEGNNSNSQNWLYELEHYSNDPTGIRKPSGMACNHWNMVDEDTELLAKTGSQAYRMSVEWSRIQPSEGEFSQEAIDHYLYELNKIKEKGIKIFMTMIHFTVPIWFDKLGGLTKIENVKYFETYLEKVVPIFAPYVDGWNVLNEEFGYREPTPENNEKRLAVMKFHARGYHIIKKYSNAPISSAHAFIMYEPQRKRDKFDSVLSEMMDIYGNEWMLHAIRTGEIVIPYYGGFYDKEVKDSMDFWAINIYTRTGIDAREPNWRGKRYDHKKLDLLGDMDFYLNEFEPEVIIHQLSRLKDKPVYITENGCSCFDDRWRIVYEALYLNALREVMDMGVDVRGYFYWSLMDNYEWSSFQPRFGLIDVDFQTFKRTMKPSASFYREVIENNGVSQELIRKYLKEMPTLAKL